MQSRFFGPFLGRFSTISSPSWPQIDQFTPLSGVNRGTFRTALQGKACGVSGAELASACHPGADSRPGPAREIAESGRIVCLTDPSGPEYVSGPVGGGGVLDLPSRRDLAGKSKESAIWLKLVDPEEVEGEHFEVYERELEISRRVRAARQ